MSSTGAIASPVPGPWWCGYLVLLVLFVVLGLLRGPGSPIGVIFALLHTFALVGVYGYVYGIAIGWREFWAGYLVLAIALDLAAAVLGYWLEPLRDTVLALILLLVAVLLLPMYVALWRYAFRSPQIWSPQTQTNPAD